MALMEATMEALLNSESVRLPILKLPFLKLNELKTEVVFYEILLVF